MLGPFARPRDASPSAFLIVIVGVVGAAMLAAASPTPASDHQLYVRRDSLQQTMLDSRERLNRWQAEQAEALAAVKIGPWHSSNLLANEQPADLIAAAQALDNLAPQQPLAERWSTVRSDGAGQPILKGAAAGYLVTTITTDEPTRLTIELSRHEKYGGFAYRPSACNAGLPEDTLLVWVNGIAAPLDNRLTAFPRVTVAQRRGWHDLILADLQLASGSNQIIISLRKGSRQSWFNSVRFTSQLAPALWALLEHDFPRTRHHLLDTVPHAWFAEPNGWFAADSTQLEEQFIAGLSAESNAAQTSLGKRLHRLQQQQPPATDSQWLDLCVTAAEVQAAIDALDSLQAATSQLASSYADAYPGPELLTRIDALRGRVLDGSRHRFDPVELQSQTVLSELDQLKYEALVTHNPMLANSELLFVKRNTYDSDHYYDEFVAGLRQFGGNLCRLSIKDKQVTDVAPDLSDGIFDRYDLSYDGQRILFSYKPPRPEGFRVFEIGVDGNHLRQVTMPPADEQERIDTYATCSQQLLADQHGRYGHWTDDMHPCYLPDGRIVFTSTRSQRSVLCGGHGLTVTNLYRTDRSGSELHQLSQGALSEFCPSVMNDGRIMYNRWEYVDKGAGAVQSLWSMSPDGSRSEEVYGNNITTPGVFNQAHSVPGRNDLIVALGAPHCPGNIGAIVLVDLQKDKRSSDAMTALTPNCVPEGNWGLRQRRNGRWITDIHGPWYCDPYPLTDAQHAAVNGSFYLVSCNPTGEWNDPAGYGLYLLDVFGNRVLLHDDPDISCWQPRPLRPRPRPPILSDAVEQPGLAQTNSATVLVSDIYQGLTGVPHGAVKYLRVMEQVPRPWSAYLGYQANDRAPGQMIAISLHAHLSVKVLHGVVPVHQDGSAYFKVPADRNIFLQALDKDYMEIQRMRTFVNFQPGEQRSCIGCHEPRHQAPENRSLLALAAPPVQLLAQPGEVAPRPLHYPTDIQPIFDRHCTDCHSGDNPDGELELTSTMTTLFNRSYENIINRDLVGHIQEFVGPKPEGADAMGYAAAVPPYTYGSHKSKLMGMIRGGHQNVRLSREELVTLATWIDANAPYYGSYFGRRNIAHQKEPDFRPIPTLDSARGIRHNK